MILLSNDDMSILICSRFMSLAEYVDLYTGEMRVDREQEFNYPLPPSFFHVMEFLEIEDYQKFAISWSSLQHYPVTHQHTALIHLFLVSNFIQMYADVVAG